MQNFIGIHNRSTNLIDPEMNKTWNQLSGSSHLIIGSDLGTELYKMYKIDSLEYKSKDSS